MNAYCGTCGRRTNEQQEHTCRNPDENPGLKPDKMMLTVPMVLACGALIGPVAILAGEIALCYRGLSHIRKSQGKDEESDSTNREAADWTWVLTIMTGAALAIHILL